MALPKKLKNFNLFNDGHSYLGEVEELTLPTLTRKMEEWRGGGMHGPIDTDHGIEKLSIEWTCGGYVAHALKQFGAQRHDAVQLRFAGAIQRDDTGEVQALEVVIRGRHSEIDFGTAKPGDPTQVKFTSSVSYYKLSIDNETIIEIDLLNMVEIINGVDLLESVRRAIGL